MAEKMQLIWVRPQALFLKIGSKSPAANWHDGRPQAAVAWLSQALLFAVRRSERAVPSAASVVRHRAVTRIG